MMLKKQPLIDIKNLTIYHHSSPILNQISLQITQGEFIFLIGQTGSGKSSLLRILYMDLPLISGSVSIAGIPISNIKKSAIPHLRRKMGIIFQDFQLLMDRNIEENLYFFLKAMGWKKKKLMKKKIADVLRRVGLSCVGDKFPHRLSGGEQQRVAIARAMLNDPLILLADEPTGNLDPVISEDILKLFLEINQEGTAVVMATHNYDLIKKYPKRILQCKQEKIHDSIHD